MRFVSEKEVSDVVELKEVLKALSEFLKEIREPLEDLLKLIIESSSGEKLAKEVAAFYKSLVESGIDENMARRLTEKFFEERLRALPSLGLLSDIIKGYTGERKTEEEGQVKPGTE